MQQKKQTKFLTTLGLIFIVLKLCGVIAWSWWLVLLPFYLGIAIIGGIFLLGGVAVALVATFKRLLK